MTAKEKAPTNRTGFEKLVHTCHIIFTSLMYERFYADNFKNVCE